MHHLDSALRHTGHPLGLSLMGASVTSWLIGNGMTLLNVTGIVVSIVIQVLTYLSKRRVDMERIRAIRKGD